MLTISWLCWGISYSHILQCFHSEPVWHFAPDLSWICWQGYVSSLTGLHIFYFELFVLWILKQSCTIGMKLTRSLSVSIIEHLFVNVNPCNYSIIFFCNFLLIFFFKVKVKSALCDDCLNTLFLSLFCIFWNIPCLRLLQGF